MMSMAEAQHVAGVTLARWEAVKTERQIPTEMARSLRLPSVMNVRVAVVTSRVSSQALFTESCFGIFCTGSANRKTRTKQDYLRRIEW